MFSINFNFRTKLWQLKDSRVKRLKILLFISLFALLFSACSSAPAEESSAPPEVQAPDPTVVPQPTSAPTETPEPEPTDAPEPTSAPTETPEPTATAIGPQILFSSYWDGSSEIFSMNPDGTDQRQLTDADTIETAFPDLVPENPELGHITIDSNSPDLSPDNQQIAFSFVGQILIMNADGTDIRLLTDEQGEKFDPTWSPDGRQIAYISNADGDREIYIVNEDGTDPKQLTDNRDQENKPTWSPDGQMIAYNSGFPIALSLINVDDGESRPLTEGKDGYGWEAAWSPDGKKIAFVSLRDGDDEIFVVNVDGSDLQQITDNSDLDVSPAWSADSQQLAFASDRDGDMEIYVVNVDGSDVRQLTDNDVVDEAPAWSSMP